MGYFNGGGESGFTVWTKLVYIHLTPYKDTIQIDGLRSYKKMEGKSL